MNYELTKKLRDAGFPQKYYDQWGQKKCVCHDNKNMTETHGIDWDVSIIENNTDYYVVPTFEELIEACKGFRYLSVDEEIWTAAGFSARGQGSTPLGAVANLWLELNKKSNETL